MPWLDTPLDSPLGQNLRIQPRLHHCCHFHPPAFTFSMGMRSRLRTSLRLDVQTSHVLEDRSETLAVPLGLYEALRMEMLEQPPPMPIQVFTLEIPSTASCIEETLHCSSPRIIEVINSQPASGSNTLCLCSSTSSSIPRYLIFAAIMNFTAKILCSWSSNWASSSLSGTNGRLELDDDPLPCPEGTIGPTM